MIREIVIYGDPVLRKKCDLVKNFSEDIHSLVEDMLETMVLHQYQSWPCSFRFPFAQEAFLQFLNGLADMP